eukprot:m.159345 g.159345  ORF g.159345 m.159345 type:complete len:2437 (+) comp53015_c0_seq1:84-7394(+)
MASSTESRGLARLNDGNVAQLSLAASMEEIQERKAKAMSAWEDFKTAAATRRAQLEDSKHLQQFIRDCDELEAWINQKLQIAMDDAHKDPTNLQGKVKKHEAFEAEIVANEDGIKTLRSTGEAMITANHYASEAVRAKLHSLALQWQFLHEKSAQKAENLKAAQQMLKFKLEADEVEGWMNDRIVIASSDDVGKDLEHVEVLEKKFDDFNNDLMANETRVDSVNDFALTLITDGHPERDAIKAKQQEFQALWVKLTALAASRKQQLRDAREIHRFNRDVAETKGRIVEKDAQLNSDDHGKDLSSVEALRRKHDGFVRDLAALRESVEALANEAVRLATEFPSKATLVEEQQQQIEDAWKLLMSNSNSRKTQLNDSHDLHRFLNDLRNSTSWINDMRALIVSDELAKDVASADALLQRNKEHKGEIDAREDSFRALLEFGNSLIAKRHSVASGLPEKLSNLESERAALHELWQKRQLQFEQCHDLQVFLRDADQIDAWIATQEAALNTDDLGDSLDSVEALIKSHDDFEKSLAAQQETTNAFKDFGNRLIGYGHYDAGAVGKRRDMIVARRERLDQLAANRRTRLEDSLHYQQFRRDAEEADAWVNEKLQTACDESYRDPTNLRGKLQNHQAFEAELKANEGMIKNVNTAGRDLIAASHYASDNVTSRLKALSEHWENLLAQSRDKGQKLKEADQHQQFSRRIEDMDAWCAEILSALSSDDLGRDLTSVQNLKKKHVLLEAEIAGHQDRIDTIAAQAKEFIAGHHFQASLIQEQQKAIAEKYSQLAAPAAARKKKLEDSLNLQQLLRDIDDEEAWIREKLPIAASFNFGNSLTGVQNLLKKHAALRAELDGRLKRVRAVEENANALCSLGHYAADDIKSRLAELRSKWEELNEAAAKRQQNLDDALNAQRYFADANEAEAWMVDKDSIVASDDFGKDEDSAQSLFKKHEAIESDLHAYKATIDNLTRQSETCKDLPSPPEHPRVRSVSNPSLTKGVRALYAYEANTEQELSVQRGDVLELVSKDNAEWWCVKSAAGVGFVPANYLEEFSEAEPSPSPYSRVGSLTDISVVASVSARQQALHETYRKLLEKAAFRRVKLEESQQLHQLSRECDDIEAFMQDREAIASQHDLGSDLEHNELIQKKFDEFLKDLVANEARINSINELANTFIEHGHSDAQLIQSRQDALNRRWRALQELAAERNRQLVSAHEVHRFFRDVDETKSRFNEKDVVLSVDDYGKDVPTVEALQRKHEGAMRDLAALDNKVNELRTEAARLKQAHPSNAAAIEGKITEIDGIWGNLQGKASDRKVKLEDSLNLQRFLNDARDLSAWISNMQTLADSDELAQDATGAETLLKNHQELKTEIEAHNGTVESLSEFAQRLQANAHFATDGVSDTLQAIHRQLDALNASMAARKKRLDQCKELQVFNRIAEQAEAWMSTHEPALSSDDVGASLDAVEALQRKHADFEKSVEAQKEKIGEVEREAQRLVAGSHYDAASINDRKLHVTDRWQSVSQLSNARRGKLGDALRLQQFLRDADEADAWMNEKLQSATDASYRDPTNLQGKLQKHQAFEAEVAANEDRIAAVIKTGEDLAKEGFAESDAITSRIALVNSHWADLCGNSKDKGQKLKEANNQQQFNYNVEDVEFWLSEVELLLSSKDHGKDLASVQNLLKKHQLVETDVAAHKDRIDSINAQANSFISAGHFDADNIRARQEAINERYRDLERLAVDRSHKLEESRKAQRIFRDIDDEESWIKEKQRIASSTDYGKDLTGVQNLQKKHETFDAELRAHNSRIDTVLATADALIAAQHDAIAEITTRRAGLATNWTALKELSLGRKQKLEETHQFQQFIAEVDEESSWINEKQSMLSSEEAPDTLSTAQSLLRKHEAFQVDLLEHQDRVKALSQQGTALIAGGNYQADELQASIAKLKTLIEGLTKTSSQRHDSLEDSFKFLQFNREADSIEAWISDKEPQAASEDYGKDLPSSQSLIARQDAFHASLLAFQPRVNTFRQNKADLVAQANTNSVAVDARDAHVATRWQKLLETSEKRKARLLESRQIHQKVEELCLTFAKKASAFNSWFENASEDLTDPVRVNSLEEIKALRAAHADFQKSLVTYREDLDQLVALDKKIAAYKVAKNPYTWFTVGTLEESWDNLNKVIQDRDNDLVAEEERQKENDELRKSFAKHANEFSGWLTQTRNALVEGKGTLESQLEATQAKYKEVLNRKSALKKIEDLGAKMEEALILDNKYTEHTTVGLAQQWDQLEQLGMRMQHNLEQQIQAKNTTGVTEEQLKDFNETFRYFDRDRSGKLSYQELKSCLRSLGYSLPVLEAGQSDPEFEAILKQLDPNGEGSVTMSDFMAFMISRETTKVESSAEVVNAFRAAAAQKPYVTSEELRKSLTADQAEYCIRRMQPYVDADGNVVPNAYDYQSFTQALFAN